MGVGAGVVCGTRGPSGASGPVADHLAGTAPALALSTKPADIANIGGKLDRIRVTLGLNCLNFGRPCAKFGQTRSNSGRNRPTSPESGPTRPSSTKLGQIQANVGLRSDSDPMSSKPAHIWTMYLADSGPNLADVTPNSPRSDKMRLNSNLFCAGFYRIRPELACSRPAFDKCWPGAATNKFASMGC